MKKRLITIIIFFTAVILSAMPPHPDVIQEYKNRGELPQLMNRISSDRAAGKSTAQRSFPSTGTNRVPVLLVGYSDFDLHDDSSDIFYSNLFTNNNGKSWKQYYKDMSNNTLNLEFDIFDLGQFVSVGNKTHDYYGTGDEYPGELAARAVVEAHENTAVDFSNYDNNNDGFVDTVIIIHQGAGEESPSGTSSDIWSHQWNLYSANILNHSSAGWDSIITEVTVSEASGNSGGILEYDGKKINSYAMHPEYYSVASPNDSTIGVFVHEFGHVLGLPDLYDTGYYNYSNPTIYPDYSDGIGSWGVMSGGSWGGGDGSIPTPMIAWSRLQLGWLDFEISNPAVAYINSGFSPLSLLFIAISVALYIIISRIFKLRKSKSISLLLIVLISFSTCGDKGTLIKKSLSDIETSQDAIIVEVDTSEYILIENKYRTSGTWSESLPGSGLLLTHIDDSLIGSRINSNSINDHSINKQIGVKVIEADGDNNLLDGYDGDSGSETDTFNSSNVDELREYITNSGLNANFELSNVSSPGSVITFDLYFPE